MDRVFLLHRLRWLKMTEREQFEAWAKREGLNLARFDRYRYADNATKAAWLSWKARCPDGWQCVPKEPTHYQQNAGSAEHFYKQGSCKDIYKAMLAAAPHSGEEI